MNGRAERETYIGLEAQHMRGVLVLKHPIKNGIIQNWDEMEKVSSTFIASIVFEGIYLTMLLASCLRIPVDKWMCN